MRAFSLLSAGCKDCVWGGGRLRWEDGKDKKAKRQENKKTRRQAYKKTRKQQDKNTRRQEDNKTSNP